MTGYWFLDEGEPWRPDPALARFLEAGEPPVYIGFGSMTTKDPARIARVVAEGVRLAGVRAILATGWGGLAEIDLPANVYVIESAPHEVLFERVSAVVHHGGAGTAAAGLRAGRPTLVCPVSVDQPRLGLAVADISGKGISAALLMANLQANLRSQQASAVADLPGLLQTVNRLFHEATEIHHYATFFFGDYDDATRCLRYANCGHNPPMILQTDGRIDELPATASVLGMFDPWEVEVLEVQLNRGDCLVIFSDGISEASSNEGEEYGEERLRQAILRHRDKPVSEMLDSITSEVQQFSGKVQEDDVTLVVARGC